jgi:hypothetical protein
MQRALLLLLFSSFIIFIGCTTNRKEEIIYNLTNNTQKYWDLVREPKWYDKSKAKIYPVYCYYIDKNGIFKLYKYQQDKRILYDGGDAVLSNTWEYLTDTTINLNGLVYKLKKLTADTLIFSLEGNVTVLAKSK